MPGLVAALIAAMIALGAWDHAHEALDEARTQLISGELQPIAGMLNENHALIKELQAEPFTEQDSPRWSAQACGHEAAPG